MIEVANQGEAMGWMLGAIAVVFFITYHLTTGKKKDSE